MSTAHKQPIEDDFPEPMPVQNQERPSPIGRQLVFSAIILAALGLTGFTLSRAGQTEPAADKAADSSQGVAVSSQGKSLAGIATGPVVEESIQTDLKAPGILSFPADHTVALSPRLQGRVSRVFVHVGDRVHAGQVLAQLVSADGAAAETTAQQDQNKLNQAKLDLDRQQRLYRLGTPDVTAAQAAYDQAVTATRAARDVLSTTNEQSKIGGFTQKPLEDASNALVTARATADQARADLELAEKDLARKKKLVQIGVAAQVDLETSQDGYDKAKIAYAADQEGVRLAQQAVDRESKAYGTNLYSKQQVEAAQNAYRQALVQEAAAATALKLAKTQIQRDLEQAQTDFESAKFDDQNAQRTLTILGHPNADGSLDITSPISGVVTSLNVSAGQTADQSQMNPWQLLTISDTSTVWVEADVYERDIASVSAGSRVAIKVPAMPDRSFIGRVSRISPIVDKASRTIKVQAVIPNPEGLLKDGEYADVQIQAGRPHQGLVVPMTAVEHEGDSDYVFVQSGGKYTKRKVTLGAPNGKGVEILTGVTRGEMVVTQGAIFLGDQANDD